MVAWNYLLNLGTARRAGEQQWHLLFVGLKKDSSIRRSRSSFPLPPLLFSWAELVSSSKQLRGMGKLMLVTKALRVEGNSAFHLIRNICFLHAGTSPCHSHQGTYLHFSLAWCFPVSDHISNNTAMASIPICEITWQITSVNLACDLLASCAGYLSFWSWGETTDLCCSWG